MKDTIGILICGIIIGVVTMWSIDYFATEDYEYTHEDVVEIMEQVAQMGETYDEVTMTDYKVIWRKVSSIGTNMEVKYYEWTIEEFIQLNLDSE